MAGCAICTNNLTCTQCQPSYNFLNNTVCCSSTQIFNIDGTCSSACNDGYFNSSFYCVPCPTICATCSDNYTCTSCNPGFVYLPFGICCNLTTPYLLNGNCVSQCPIGQYPDPITGNCSGFLDKLTFRLLFKLRLLHRPQLQLVHFVHLRLWRPRRALLR